MVTETYPTHTHIGFLSIMENGSQQTIAMTIFLFSPIPSVSIVRNSMERQKQPSDQLFDQRVVSLVLFNDFRVVSDFHKKLAPTEFMD